MGHSWEAMGRRAAGTGRALRIRRRSSARGTSFVEIAVATLFLALAIVPLFDSILTSSQRVREDRARVFATSLAATAMERLRLEDPPGCGAAAASLDIDPLVNPVSPPSGAPTALDIWWQYRNGFLVEADCPPAGGTAILTVRVSWQEGTETRKVQMQTLLAPTFAGGAP